MSGGRWNYQEFQVGDLGETLARHENAALATLWRTLIEAADIIRAFDYVYSGDTGDEAIPDLEARVGRLLTPAAVAATALERAEAALAELRRHVPAPAGQGRG